MRTALPSVFVACLVPGCVGTPPPPPAEDGSSSSTADSSITTTTGPTSAGTLDGTGSSSSEGTTQGASATDATTTDATTMGVDPTTSGSSGPPQECMGPADCGNNETCDGAGQCVPACSPWGDGHYDYCLTVLGTFDSAAICGEPLSCINNGSPIEIVVCGRSCTTACDCPEPPPTGTATVSCGEITGGGSSCYLSCQNGETCPDGMLCQGDSYCAHPVQPLAMYGNCGDVAAPCIDGVCATQSVGMSTYSVCVSLCPGGVGDCDPAPPGAGLGSDCGGVVFPPDGAECHLPCNANGDCPSGMECVDTGIMGASTLCMWP